MKNLVASLYFILSLPWSGLYSFIIQIRNLLYEYGIKKSDVFATPVISIGNLNLGGSGKTPCIAYLVPLFQGKGIIIVLSRGYKRNTKGLIIAQESDTALSIGDEAYQLYKQFYSNQQLKVAVSENRAQGITQLLNIFSHPQVILLDDAFQHRKVKPSLNILLTDFKKPFFTDYVIPTGRLREPRKAAQRADIILVTKCPYTLSEDTKHSFRQTIYPYCRDEKTPIFFTRIRYHLPTPIWKNQQRLFSSNILLITGIANAQPLVDYVRAKYHLIHHIAFKDHHSFTKGDLKNVLSCFNQLRHPQKCILTTEKDSVRLQHPDLKILLQGVPIFYLPMTMEFLEDEKKFKHLIFEHIAYYKSFYIY